MHYLAIIGDVVASRRLTERRKFGRRLESALLKLNQRRGRALAWPYAVTPGDLVGRSVAELAAETGITTRAVSKYIRAAELDEWQ